jgi:hypothetical protein
MFITLADEKPRQVVVEVFAPTDRRYALTIQQGLAIGPTPVTIPIYVPLSYSVDETAIVVRDANTGRSLGSTVLADYPTYSGLSTGITSVSSTNLFIGISGNASTQRLAAAQFTQQQNINAGFLPQPRLPAVVAGYDGIDVLLLNAPDLNRIALDQQSAIVEWVRGGGILIMWPGVEPVPLVGPIQNILPARIGETRTIDIDKSLIEAAGLPARFSRLTARKLDDISDDATSVNIFGDGEPRAYRRWVGVGQVLLISADMSGLMFNDGVKSVAFWRKVLRDVVAIPQLDTNSQPAYYHGYGEADPRHSQAKQQSMNWIANVPGAGSFGFSYVAIVLIAMMLIVGPVDWFVLKRMGRQPWTWVTISGWIALITLCAIYVGHIFKSGDLHFRTVSLVDEAAGARVGAFDLAGLYSPRTKRYEFEFDPHTWWMAASEGTMFGGGGLRIDIKSHQDYRGTRPLPMLVNVWNLRFLQGTDASDAPPMLSAKLNANSVGEISGTITNQSDTTIKLVAVRTKRGLLKLDQSIGAGGSVSISGKLTTRDNSYATTRPAQQDAWRFYNQQNMATTVRPAMPQVTWLAPQRSDRIEQALNDREDLVCLYGEFDAPPPRVKFNDDTAKREHLGFVRALVTMEK